MENQNERSIKLFTVPEVAQILKVKKSYVYELIYSYRLHFIQLSQRRIRIEESSLKEYIMSKNGNNNSGLPRKGGV